MAAEQFVDTKGKYRTIDVVGIERQVCSHPQYGQGGCTATHPEPCVHTIPTCRKRCDFACENSTDYHTSCDTTQLLDVARGIIPDVVSTRTTTGKLELCKPMPSAGTLDVTLQDSPGCDYLDDPYRDQRSLQNGPYAPGTRLEKYIQRNILEGRRVDYSRGFSESQYPDDFLSNTYFVDSIDGPDRDCQYTIRAKDPLAWFLASRPQYPRPTDLRLRADLAPGHTQLVVDPVEFPATVNVLCIDREAIRVRWVRRISTDSGATIDGDLYDVLERGFCGSTAHTESIDAAEETVQIGAYWPDGTEVGEVIFDVLFQGGHGLPLSDQECDCGPLQKCVIDGASFADIRRECGRFDRVCETVICEPMNVDDILEQLMPFFTRPYFDDNSGKIKLHRYSPPQCGQDIPQDDYCDIVGADIEIRTKRTERTSEVQLLSHPRDCTQDSDDNYARQTISKSRSSLGNSCDNPEWRSPRIKELKSRFIGPSNAHVADLAVNRMQFIRNQTPREITYSIGRTKTPPCKSEYRVVCHPKLQEWDGSASREIWFVNQVDYRDDCWRITAESSGFRTDQRWITSAECDECGLIQQENDECELSCPMVW